MNNEQRYLKVRAYIRAGLVSSLFPAEFDDVDARTSEPEMLEIVDRHVDNLPELKD